MTNTQKDNPMFAAMRSSEKQWAEKNLAQAWHEMARNLWNYFSALVKLGFKRAEALQLVIQFQAATFNAGIIQSQVAKMMGEKTSDDT